MFRMSKAVVVGCCENDDERWDFQICGEFVD